MQIIQQLTGSLVEGSLDAGTAQAIDGLLDGVQVTLTGCTRAEGGWAPVQTQNGLLHLVQQLYVYAYLVLHQGAQHACEILLDIIGIDWREASTRGTTSICGVP